MAIITPTLFHTKEKVEKTPLARYVFKNIAENEYKYIYT